MPTMVKWETYHGITAWRKQRDGIGAEGKYAIATYLY